LVGSFFLHVVTGIDTVAGHTGSPGPPDAEDIMVIELGKVVSRAP
jgi:hypothetical protein